MVQIHAPEQKSVSTLNPKTLEELAREVIRNFTEVGVTVEADNYGLRHALTELQRFLGMIPELGTPVEHRLTLEDPSQLEGYEFRDKHAEEYLLLHPWERQFLQPMRGKLLGLFGFEAECLYLAMSEGTLFLELETLGEVKDTRAKVNAFDDWLYSEYPLNTPVIILSPTFVLAADDAHLVCPKCSKTHVDEGLWAVKRHRTHRCVDDFCGQGCGHEWRLEEYVRGVLPPEVE